MDVMSFRLDAGEVEALIVKKGPHQLDHGSSVGLDQTPNVEILDCLLEINHVYVTPPNSREGMETLIME